MDNAEVQKNIFLKKLNSSIFYHNKHIYCLHLGQ